jgi:hypothetical protein
MKDVWEPVGGTRFFSRNGEGLYERLTDRLYLRVDEVDEIDAQEVCTRFADAYKFRAGDRLLIPAGYAGLVNHSKARANLEKVVAGHEVFLRVTRPVAAGEELFFCYSDYAQERFGLSDPDNGA